MSRFGAVTGRFADEVATCLDDWLVCSAAEMTVADAQLDATGLVCPEPLMLVRNRIRSMAAGEVLHVTATDPSTRRDLTNFCRFMEHTMLEEGQRGDVYFFVIRKGG
jgi:tRNA 2-thiouridine synthesizing protein A